MNITFPPTFAKSWKTTTMGFLAAIYPVAQGFKAFQTGDWKTLSHDPIFWGAMIVAVQGWVGKDGNVTGGSVGQPSTPQALADANQAAAKGVNAPEKP